MRALDQAGSLFWLLVAVYVFMESLRLGLGTPRNPGMGFMTFGGSILLAIFSLIIFFQGFFKREKPEAKPPAAETLWARVLAVAVALLLYSCLMPFLGYLINTFLLMSFLFGIIRRMKWRWVFVSSFATTAATYYLFSKLLNCQFPYGLFGV
jgi:hypothetical protein